MSTVTIHGFPQSSYVWTARATAAIKGVEYTLDAMAPGDHRGEAHLARHPFAKVPALTHGDLTLFECEAICEYLDRKFDGPALQPTDAAENARMRQWISAANCYVYRHTVIDYLFAYLFPKTEDGQPDRGTVDKAAGRLGETVGVLDRALAGREWLAGDSLSLADLFVGPMVMAASTRPEGKAVLGDHPNVAGFVGRLAQNGAFMSAAPPRG